MSKYRKKIKILFYTLAIVLVGLYFVNWYITYRLEDKLASVLAKNVSDATDGFYQLSFKKLSVGLLGGELSIEDLSLKPDSAVFAQWKANDSLPEEYVQVKIKAINFKGVNFKFRKSFKQLNFSLFEIKFPDIEMIKPLDSRKSIKEKTVTKIDDPYSFIAKYVDVLSVKKLNLENAKVSYIVEDSIKPSIYKLQDFNFHIHGFRLDKNSFLNGKLIYSDNFNFTVNSSQTLLSNRDFEITVNEIRLDTKDSIIHVKNLSLTPQKELWNSLNQKLSRSLEVKLGALDLNGMSFSREEGFRALRVNNFELSSPQIKIENYTTKAIKNIPNDTITKALPLYKIISPVINRLEINTIKLNNAQLDYARTSTKGTDRYSLTNLNFYAEQFLVDSLETSTFNFLHCNHFGFEAHNLDGKLIDRNHEIKVNTLSFDSKTKNLRVKDIAIQPLLSNEKSDYLTGKIDLLDIQQVDYNEVSRKLTASLVQVTTPNINYTRISSSKTHTTQQTSLVIDGILNSLLVGKIKVQDGDIVFTQKKGKYTDTHIANNLNTTITKLEVNRKVSIQDINISIGKIESNLSKPHLKLSADNILFNSLHQSTISVQNISLSDKLAELHIPLLRVEGALLFEPDKFSFSSFRVEKPEFKQTKIAIYSDGLLATNIDWHKNNKNFSFEHLLVPNIRVKQMSTNSIVDVAINDLRIDTLSWQKELFLIKNVTIKSPIVSYENNPTKAASKNRFEPYKLLNKLSDSILINQFKLVDASIKVSSIEKDKQIQHKLNETNLYTKDLAVNTVKRNYQVSELNLSSKHFQFPLDNGFYTLKIDSVFADLKRSNLSVHNIKLVPKYDKFEFAYKHPKNKDWFSASIKDINISGIDMPTYFDTKKLYINNIAIKNAELDNFKNQRIEIEHNIMPMIYEGLYKLPIQFDVKKASVTNFAVCYEELTHNKNNKPGKIFFSNLNGEFSGLTNMLIDTAQYINLDANGLLMGRGYFEATWKIPASPLNDHFNLKGTLHHFDLTELNQLIEPMAPARVKSGTVKTLDFDINATSLGAHIEMTFLYNDLRVSAWSAKNDKIRYQNLFSRLANSVIKHDNPNKRSKHPRVANIDMIRDPYHSTFNYLWQILQPATIESVGISQRRQNRLQRMTNNLKKIKHFFKPQKKDKKEEGEEN